MLARIALVDPGIHPQNAQRDRFTPGPPRLLHSMFGGSVSTKPPLTSVFLKRLTLTHIPANDARLGASGEENGSKKIIRARALARTNNNRYVRHVAI